MSEPRVKKTSLACDSCRRRKRKCDGKTPTCTTCQRGNLECSYTTSLEQRRPPQKNYVAALEARIAQLEQILKNESDSSTDTPSPIATPVALPDHITDLLESTSKDTDLGMSDYQVLVSLELEHKLLAQFYDWQRMHLPFVPPVPFMSAYAIHSELVHPNEPIPAPPPPPPNSFAATSLNVPRASAVPRTPDLPHFISPLLVYSMFAIAALFHGDPETADMFYQRARERLLIEAANPKVATIQAACLMSTWETGHARPTAAWTLTSVALSLCIRLGMNIDATPLVQNGTISQRLYDTRNFTFWAAFNSDRFLATCMGMRPLIDRRIISIPKHSSPTTDTKSRSKDFTWWSASTLGMGDVLVQAAWDTIQAMVDMMDELYDSVYATDAGTRTPQEILELVTRNHLTIQKFIDGLPTWLRSTGAIRRKESGLIYLHLFIHLTAILTNRPFLSAHHACSPITRQYRTLAFRVARASALQVSSLIRHIALSSPCVTIPYIVYSASTVLLLAPEDRASMDGVRTGLACLDGMDQTGYWVDSAKDAARRVRALADKWGVGLESSRRVLGLVGVKSGESVSPVNGSETSVPSRPGTSGGIPAYIEDSTLAIDAEIDRALQLPIPTCQDPPRHAYHPYKRHKKLPHVAYADSHADPAHDMNLAHAHWHTIIPPLDPALLIPPDPNTFFPPDPSACADVGTCFTYTVQHAQDPLFVDQVGDPYVGVSMDWTRDWTGVPWVLGGGQGLDAGY
ncbi:unnamed protein product [Rhizoctonia solani]|uniref:Zn(2)-C6 fungal-type domain-containing protein n=1 Tax=Rhizoctonia solani TaxID=456999 RepID=A0A8H3DVV2_9AGAM|nr:unnamed protein product [Rhizoctonia solani]